MDRPPNLRAEAPTAGLREQTQTPNPVASELTFENLFAAEHQRLFQAMYLITGNTEDAEELMQDAFLKVWGRWERVRTMENPAGYLCRTAINGARSRHRRLVRAAKRSMTFGGAEDAFAAADLRDALVRAMRTLGPRQRSALVLTDYLGFGSEEAAGLLGVNPSTVRSLATQARGHLRDAMEADDG